MVFLLALLVFATSVLSGALGMGGGFLLMIAAAVLLPISQAMVVHGIVQFLANGTRAVLHLRYVYWNFVALYCLGFLVPVVLLAVSYAALPKHWVWLGLGCMPFLGGLVRNLSVADAQHPLGALCCGVVVPAAQIVFGVSGPLLDVFFMNTSLSRYQVVATKALTQTLGHGAKIFHYGVLFDALEVLPESYLWLAPLPFVGTWVGGRILEKLTDRQFQKVGGWWLKGVGGVLIGWALLNFAGVVGGAP